MSLHKEISFELEICQHLASHGWLYADGDAAGFDRVRALFPADVLAWVQATQPKAWETLAKSHGSKAEETLLTRLRDQLDQRGTLDVLRHGVELLGLKTPLTLAQFKPALAINPDILARYAANRLRVVRQVRYSLHNENSIDLVLFLNGLPVATVELKTDFTQIIGDAIDQYRFDRHPKPKGQATEPLLSFPSGALIHFAVSNMEVAMVTHLVGPGTVFLPFNLGNEGAAGNPVNQAGGHRTAYLWEQVWERESWLEILGRYVRNVNSSDASLQALENLGNYCPSPAACELIKSRAQDAQERYDEVRNRNASSALDAALVIVAKYCQGGGLQRSRNSQTSTGSPQPPTLTIRKPLGYETKDTFGTIVNSESCHWTKDAHGNDVRSAACSR